MNMYTVTAGYSTTMRTLKIKSDTILTFQWRLDSRVVVRVMVFNATFNNISVISWRSVLLVEEIREP